MWSMKATAAILLLCALASTTVYSLPLRYQGVLSDRAKAMADQRLSNVIQRAAKNLLNKMESRPAISPAPTPGIGLKLHLRPAQQPQDYYKLPVLARPSPPPALPSVHIHPIKPVQPVQPVPEIPGIHLYPPQRQPLAPGTPHLHIHPSSPNQRVAIKPPPSIPSGQPLSRSPVLHVHPPTHSVNGKGGSDKDKKENDVQLKLNMDFKSHNRTGFQELQRQMNKAQLQSNQMVRGNGYQTSREMKELSNLITERIMQRVKELMLNI